MKEKRFGRGNNNVPMHPKDQTTTRWRWFCWLLKDSITLELLMYQKRTPNPSIEITEKIIFAKFGLDKSVRSNDLDWFCETCKKNNILLMEEIQLGSWYGSLSHYLQGFIHVRWLAGLLPSTVSLAFIVFIQTNSPLIGSLNKLVHSTKKKHTGNTMKKTP